MVKYSISREEFYRLSGLSSDFSSYVRRKIIDSKYFKSIEYIINKYFPDSIDNDCTSIPGKEIYFTISNKHYSFTEDTQEGWILIQQWDKSCINYYYKLDGLKDFEIFLKTLKLNNK